MQTFKTAHEVIDLRIGKAASCHDLRLNKTAHFGIVGGIGAGHNLQRIRDRCGGRRTAGAVSHGDREVRGSRTGWRAADRTGCGVERQADGQSA